MTSSIKLLFFLFLLCIFSSSALAAYTADNGTWIGVLYHEGSLLPIGLYKDGQWSNPWPAYGTIPELTIPESNYSSKPTSKSIKLENVPPQRIGGIAIPDRWYTWSETANTKIIKADRLYNGGCFYTLATDDKSGPREELKKNPNFSSCEALSYNESPHAEITSNKNLKTFLFKRISLKSAETTELLKNIKGSFPREEKKAIEAWRERLRKRESNSAHANKDSGAFLPEELDPDLFKKIQNQENPISKYLSKQLQIDKHSRWSESELTAAMNGFIANEKKFHTPERFQGIIFSDDTKRLLAKKARTPEQIKVLNRLLLEDAYPKLIARGTYFQTDTILQKSDIRIRVAYKVFDSISEGELYYVEAFQTHEDIWAYKYMTFFTCWLVYKNKQPIIVLSKAVIDSCESDSAQNYLRIIPRAVMSIEGLSYIIAERYGYEWLDFIILQYEYYPNGISEAISIRGDCF